MATSMTVDGYEHQLKVFCMRVFSDVTKKYGAPRRLRITWPDGPYWTVVHNLSWAAEGAGFSATAVKDTSLPVGPFPRAKLNALRKRFPDCAGFFLGEEGQDTLDPEEDIEYMPSECSYWIMGIFDETIARVENQLCADPSFARCKLQLMGHDGSAPLRLRDHLKSVPDLRQQHGYTPEAELIATFLRVWTCSEANVERWLRCNPKSPRATTAKKKAPVSQEPGGLWSKDVQKLRGALCDLWVTLHADPQKSLDQATLARAIELASHDPDETVRQNALYLLGRARPFDAQIRALAIKATEAKETSIRVAGMLALAESGDAVARAEFLARLPHLSSFDGLLVAGSGFTDPTLKEMAEQLRSKKDA